MTGRSEIGRPLLAAAAGAAVTGLVLRGLDSRTGAGWRRTNYRGRTVTLSGGPAVAVGLLAGIGAGGVAFSGESIAVAGAAAAGFYDDRASARAEERAVKGFAGHLGALAGGKASAGMVKLGVIGASSLAAAGVRTGARATTVLDGCLIAGAANLANLLDLRPGRALKVAGLVAGLCTPAARGHERMLLGAGYGVLAAALPADLGERSMLGDTGANAMGALIGCLLCRRGRPTRVVALLTVAGLTALSEKVSFTALISAHPLLRRLDELGRAGD